MIFYNYFGFNDFAECNRTYYGSVGLTNHLELPRLRDERLPFVCELNFTAAGGAHGDIVQVCIIVYSIDEYLNIFVSKK